MFWPRVDPTRAMRVDPSDGRPFHSSLHRLVSRRSPPLRSSCPACRLEHRRGGDLSLRVRRSKRSAARTRRPPARRRGAMVAGAVAPGSAKEPPRGWHIATAAQRARGTIIAGLARETQAGKVFWNEIAQAPHQTVAGQVAAALETIGVASQSFAGDLLTVPIAIRNKEGRGLRVFTPFWRRVQNLGDPPKPLPPPKTLRPVLDIASDTLEAWRLEPTHPDWAGGLRETWQPGEIAAQTKLHRFLESGVAFYAGDRDRPDRRGTSGLSPHLRFGEISPRQVWHAARFAAAERPHLAGGIDKYLSELGWREFCRHLLFDVPDLAARNL
jgi:hypothetical protein